MHVSALRMLDKCCNDTEVKSAQLVIITFVILHPASQLLIKPQEAKDIRMLQRETALERDELREANRVLRLQLKHAQGQRGLQRHLPQAGRNLPDQQGIAAVHTSPTQVLLQVPCLT